MPNVVKMGPMIDVSLANIHFLTCPRAHAPFSLSVFSLSCSVYAFGMYGRRIVGLIVSLHQLGPIQRLMVGRPEGHLARKPSTSKPAGDGNIPRG